MPRAGWSLLLAVRPLSLVPELPGARVINQLLNPWNWVNFASMTISLVNLFLYHRLRQHNSALAGGTNINIKVQNVPIIEERSIPAINLRDRPTIEGPTQLPLTFEVNVRTHPRSCIVSLAKSRHCRLRCLFLDLAKAFDNTTIT